MKPVKVGNEIVEVLLENNEYTVKTTNKLNVPEDKYYLVENNNNYGIYHKDFGLSMEFTLK